MVADPLALFDDDEEEAFRKERKEVEKIHGQDILQKIREDFEEQVTHCIEKQKLLTCDYDKNAVFTNPWACKVCECKAGKWTKNCEQINPVKYIISVYPDRLQKYDRTATITLPPGTSVKGPHNTGGMEHISCGDKKDHTLKLTQLGGAKLIKFPEGVPTTVTHEAYGRQTVFINRNLWSKDTIDVRPFQMKEDLLKQLPTEYTYNERMPGAPHTTVYPVWKDDWSEEYEGAEFFTSSFLPKMPPPEWGDKEALREWVSNAIDVTPSSGKVDIKTDTHGDIVLDYESSDQRILDVKHLCCLGSHEEALTEKEHEGIIGRFGEGIKQANVIFMRKNRWMKIEAVGNTYYPVWGWNKQAKTYLVNTYIVPNKRKHGTKITILNVEEPKNLIEETKKLYLRWRTDYNVLFEDDEGNQILADFKKDPAGSRRIAVNGSLTQEITGEEGSPPMLFNYNLHANDEEKEKLVDRDRKFADVDGIRSRARTIFMKLGEKEKDLMHDICEAYNANKTGFDLRGYWDMSHLPGETRRLWKEVVDDVLGNKTGAAKIAIQWDGALKDENLRALGWRIMNWGSAGNSLLLQCGYRTANQFSEALGTPRVIPYSELEPGEIEVYEQAKENLRFLLKNYWKETDDYIDSLLRDESYDQYGGMAVASSFQGCEEAEDLEGIWGMYRSDPVDKIYVLRDALRDGVIQTTGVLIHELIHRYYNVGDECREFENRFTYLAGHTGHKWAIIQTAIKTEYERTGDPKILSVFPYEVRNAIYEETDAVEVEATTEETIKMRKGDWVEIVDIGVTDSYYPEKGQYIGLKGELLTDTEGGAKTGWMKATVDLPETINGQPAFRGYVFDLVKLKPTTKIEEIEEITCWRCENISAIAGSPTIMPVSKVIPAYDATTRVFAKCGEGAAIEFPYLLKPKCEEGY